MEKHNRDILKKLVLEDGSVLRASTNAVPTLDCLFRDPQQDGGGLLQVWAVNPLPGIVGRGNHRGACGFDALEDRRYLFFLLYLRIGAVAGCSFPRKPA